MAKKRTDEDELNEGIILLELLPVWQPLAAIAARSEIPIRTCLVILDRLHEKGVVMRVRARIDGHHRVYCYKKMQLRNILGVLTPVDLNEYEEL